MIIKSFETNKINIHNNNIILVYGKNEGLKKQITDKLTSKFTDIKIYEEKEILDNSNNFLENILNKSLFSEDQIFIIKRATDKIHKIVEEINLKETSDIILINSDNLDKKSKLRSFFEKDKKLICIPVYPDNEQTLSKLSFEFFKKHSPKTYAIHHEAVDKVLKQIWSITPLKRLVHERNRTDFEEIFREHNNIDKSDSIDLFDWSEEE